MSKILQIIYENCEKTFFDLLQVLDPLPELLALVGVRHEQVHAVIADQFAVALEARDAEELVEEGVEEASIEVVVDLAAVDALGHELEDGVEGHLLNQRVRRMNREN